MYYRPDEHDNSLQKDKEIPKCLYILNTGKCAKKVVSLPCSPQRPPHEFLTIQYGMVLLKAGYSATPNPTIKTPWSNDDGRQSAFLENVF